MTIAFPILDAFHSMTTLLLRRSELGPQQSSVSETFAPMSRFETIHWSLPPLNFFSDTRVEFRLVLFITQGRFGMWPKVEVAVEPTETLTQRSVDSKSDAEL